MHPTHHRHFCHARSQKNVFPHSIFAGWWQQTHSVPCIGQHTRLWIQSTGGLRMCFDTSSLAFISKWWTSHAPCWRSSRIPIMQNLWRPLDLHLYVYAFTNSSKIEHHWVDCHFLWWEISGLDFILMSTAVVFTEVYDCYNFIRFQFEKKLG